MPESGVLSRMDSRSDGLKDKCSQTPELVGKNGVLRVE